MDAHQQLQALRSVQAWYDAHIANCPRSLEWKHGARAGCWKANGLQPQRSPWASGICELLASNHARSCAGVACGGGGFCAAICKMASSCCADMCGPFAQR